MYAFLDVYGMSQSGQDKIDNLNIPIAEKKIE